MGGLPGAAFGGKANWTWHATLRLTAEWLVAASRCKHGYLQARNRGFRGNWGALGDCSQRSRQIFEPPIALIECLGLIALGAPERRTARWRCTAPLLKKAELIPVYGRLRGWHAFFREI